MSEAEREVGKIVCRYSAIVFSRDKYRYSRTIVPMRNRSLLRSDAFKVWCTSSFGKRYSEIRACISRKTLSSTVRNTSKTRYNVFIYGFDSVSRNLLQRFLPTTHEYFTKELGGQILTGYNVVGDGTVANLMPMLTGRNETEVPELNRGRPGARHVDDVLTFVWKRFENQGYVTQWAEDMPKLGTFHYRMYGFRKQPVHHYMRTFHLASLPQTNKYPTGPRHCVGKQRSHKVYVNWLREGLITNKGKPYFTFGFFSEYTHGSHGDSDCFGMADEDSLSLLRLIKDVGVLQKTFVIIIGDHGARFGKMRRTEQGKLEERTPYFGIYVPEAFRNEFPHKFSNFLANTNRLTTPFDIYETLVDIAGDVDVNARNNKRSYSLFDEIPNERTCEDAGIAPHWCACLTWVNVSTNENNINIVAKETVKYFNGLLTEAANLCHELTLEYVTKAERMNSNNKMLRFRKTKDAKGRFVDMSDFTKPDYLYYQITIETSPGGGLFEVTASVHTRSGVVSIANNSLSRINAYKDASACVVDSHPDLRSLCVCKDNS